MKRIYLLLCVALLCASFAGCSDDKDKDREKMVEMTIYPETGFNKSLLDDLFIEPLYFSESDEPQKRMLMSTITEGFDFEYERGYQYTFPAKKVWMTNPPMDVSNIKYVFVGPLTKTKVVTEGSEKDVQLIVAPETVKFGPCYPVEYGEDGKPKVYDAMMVGVNNSSSNNDYVIVKEIEGFEYEPGYRYKLIATKIVQATPYSVRHVLREVVAKEAAAPDSM